MAKTSWGTLTSLFIKADAPAPPPSLPEEPLEEEVPVEVHLGASGAPEVPEGRPFGDLYSEHGVPVSAFPVEKLLAVIEGLSNMQPDQIRMVVAAMDAADTTWTISDPVSDAQAKILVLQAEKARLMATAQQVDVDGKAEITALDEKLTATGADIKQQIESLQTQLHAEITRTAEAKSAVEARSRAAREAAAREGVRLDAEVSRLIRVPNTFGASLPSGGK